MTTYYKLRKVNLGSSSDLDLTFIPVIGEGSAEKLEIVLRIASSDPLFFHRADVELATNRTASSVPSGTVATIMAVRGISAPVD